MPKTVTRLVAHNEILLCCCTKGIMVTFGQAALIKKMKTKHAHCHGRNYCLRKQGGDYKGSTLSHEGAT